jgi:hypothetical protein
MVYSSAGRYTATSVSRVSSREFSQRLLTDVSWRMSYERCLGNVFKQKKVSVGAVHWIACIFWLRIYRTFKCKSSRKVDESRRRNFMAIYVAGLEHVGLLCGVV